MKYTNRRIGVILTPEEAVTIQSELHKKGYSIRILTKQLGTYVSLIQRVFSSRAGLTSNEATKMYELLEKNPRFEFLKARARDHSIHQLGNLIQEKPQNIWRPVYDQYMRTLGAIYDWLPDIASKTAILQGLEEIINEHRPKDEGSQ